MLSITISAAVVQLRVLALFWGRRQRRRCLGRGTGVLQRQWARCCCGCGCGRRPRREHLAPRPLPRVSRPNARPAPPPPRPDEACGGGRGGRLGRGAGTTPSGTRSRRGCGASGRSSAGGKTARTTAFRRARRGWTCEGSLPPPRAAPTLCLRPARAAYAPPGTSRAQAGPRCRRAVSVLTSSRDERRGARGPAFGCKPLGRG